MPLNYRLNANDTTGATTITWTDVVAAATTTGGAAYGTTTEAGNLFDILGRARKVTWTTFRANPHEPVDADHEDYDWTTDPEASEMAQAVAVELDAASIEKLTTEAIAGDAADKKAVIEKAQKMAALVYKGVTHRRRRDSLKPDFKTVEEAIKRIDGLGGKLQALMDEFHAAQERIKNEEEFNEFDELEQEFSKKFRSLYRETDKAARSCQESSYLLDTTRRHLEDGMIIEVMSVDNDGDMKFRLARQMVALINNYGIDNVEVKGKDKAIQLVVEIPAKILETKNKKHRLSLSSAKIYWNPYQGVEFSAKYTNPKLSDDGRQHPHVMRGNHICLGNADVELGGSVKEGRVFDVFKTIETLLSDAKEHGMYSIQRWPDCEIKCAISNEWMSQRDAQIVRVKGRDIQVKKELVARCPVTGQNVIKGGDDSIEHDGVIYHRDAFLHAEGHDPMPATDPAAFTSVLSQQKIHPANVAVCEISGIAGRKMDGNNKQIQYPDDIVELQDGRWVAMCMLDLALLDDTTNFGSRGNLLRNWSREKKDQMQNLMSYLSNKYERGATNGYYLPDWLHQSPAWRGTLEDNQGVMLA